MSNSTTCGEIGEEYCGFLYGIVGSMIFILCYSCTRGCALSRTYYARKTGNIERKLPRIIVEDATDYDFQCPICIDNIVTDDEICKLPCGHYFHSDCIYQWILEKNVCPLCKMEAVKGLIA